MLHFKKSWKTVWGKCLDLPHWLFCHSHNAIRFGGFFTWKPYTIITLWTVSCFSELDIHCFNTNNPPKWTVLWDLQNWRIVATALRMNLITCTCTPGHTGTLSSASWCLTTDDIKSGDNFCTLWATYLARWLRYCQNVHHFLRIHFGNDIPQKSQGVTQDAWIRHQD